jgi:hypothetical protein
LLLFAKGSQSFSGAERSEHRNLSREIQVSFKKKPSDKRGFSRSLSRGRRRIGIAFFGRGAKKKSLRFAAQNRFCIFVCVDSSEEEEKDKEESRSPENKGQKGIHSLPLPGSFGRW